jgi:hypothetical protein
MRPIVSPLLFSAVLILASVGCSKKNQQPTGPDADSAGPPPPQFKKPDLPSSPDAAIADFKAKCLKMNTLDPDANDFAFMNLKKVIPSNHARRADAFRALVEVGTESEDIPNKGSYLAAAAEYAGKEEVPELIAIVDRESHDTTLYKAAVKQLKTLKDSKSAAAAAKWLATRNLNGYDRDAAGLLRAIGPPAESAVRPYAQAKLPSEKSNTNLDVRVEALMILKDIGTAESLPALQALKTDPAARIQREAQEAIKAIQARAGKTKS